MLCKVIATPAKTGAGAWEGWDFTPDDGRPLSNGEIRFTYNPRLRDYYFNILKQARRDYLRDIDEHYKIYKASRQALEYTQAMSAKKREIDRFIREGWKLKHESL